LTVTDDPPDNPLQGTFTPLDPARAGHTHKKLQVVRFKIENTNLQVVLKEISYEHFHDVIELELESEQEKHLPSNLYSIAKSSFSTCAIGAACQVCSYTCVRHFLLFLS